ncbi:MAG: asparagine synthase (glutamine-hydrolyzing) [Chloroflexota bacterium]|nr:asparagine synthase (glutamine-hydrolyzing) [Chloroflexota bacterium]
MCGICGILDDGGRLAPIAAMNWVQRQRGPDDEGYLFINTVTGERCMAGGPSTPQVLHLIGHQFVASEQYNLVLGSRRLAILDLSPAGHMPMAYLDGQLWLTYNGEIYNYRELKAELKQLGYHFVSESDTEVILAAYSEWGVDCLTRFNGMFAFVLWDARRQRLFCARDRFGVKPFYYYWNGSSFVFASEIKALVQHPLVERNPNDEVIFDYLALGLSDHSDQTFLEAITSLPPGHFLLVNVHEKQLTRQAWWQAEINPALGSPRMDEPHVYAEFSELLEDAIRLRLRSDVAVGTCLSGGLDSSAIVTLANRLLLGEGVIPRRLVGEHQKTFTARNHASEIDEHAYSQQIIQQTGAEENLVFPDGEQLWQEFEHFIWAMDEPVNSSSQYAQWAVMRLAKERGVTVLLNGQGGDEILAGYYAYYPPYVSQILQQQGVPAALRAVWHGARVGGAPVVNLLVEQATQQMPWRIQQLVRALRPPRLAPGQGGTGLQTWQLSPTFIQRFWERRWQPSLSAHTDSLVSLLYRDLTMTNLPKLLRYEDRNSMAFSLETRLPFLDYRLVEMVFRLPLNYRMQRGWSKWILRHSLREQLPPEICWRRTKLGFPTPEQTWLTRGSGYIRPLLQQHATDPVLERYLPPGLLHQIQQQSDAALAATPGLWRLINLIVWLDLYVNQSKHVDLPSQPQPATPVSLAA